MRSLATVGLTLTFPVVMGIEMVGGTSVMYALEPAQNPALLFPALGCVAVAVGLRRGVGP